MLRPTFALVCIAASLTPFAIAAEDTTARDHYFDAARNSDSEWLGLRTSVLLRRAGKDIGAVTEVGEDADYHSGDQFRLRVQANQDGYPYLLVPQQNGDYRIVYPSKASKAKADKVRAFEDRAIPANSKDWLVFDNKPAIEGIYLLFAVKPIPEIERAREDSNTLRKSVFESLMSANGGTTSQVFDEVADEGAGLLPATFYVERQATGRTFLARKIDLVHRNAPRKDDNR
jgi:hypothetical protein